MGPDDRPAVEQIIREDEVRREWLCRAAPELPCFGVPDWDGRLQVSRHGGSPTVVLHDIELKHDRDDGAHVAVRTTRRDARRETRLMRAEASPDRENTRVAPRDGDSLEPGRPVAIQVDGETVDFELWGGDSQWWAAATHAERGVAIAATGVAVADVRLARIVDLEPYFSFRDAMMRKMRDHLDGMG